MKSNFEHLMVDLETLNTENDAVILSIGAVYFDVNTGEIGKKFYVNINIQSCLNAGLKVKGDTIEWWLEQDAKAIEVLTKDKENLDSALCMFRAFLEPNVYIWGNSARFDLGILANAYTALGQGIPWNFRLERCYRTLAGLIPGVKNVSDFKGIKHNAIDDCINQIVIATKIYNKLNLTNGTNNG